MLRSLPLLAVPALWVFSAPAQAQFFPETDFTGLFVGAYAGAGSAQPDGAEAQPIEAVGGISGGVTGGFQMQITYAVLGIEGDWGGGAITGRYEVGTVAAEGNIDFDMLAGLRGRAGLTLGSAQVYATGGLALAHAKTGDVEANPGEWLGGYSYGAGVEYALTDNLSLDAKYLRSELAAPDWTGLNLGETVHSNQFRIGVNFRF